MRRGFCGYCVGYTGDPALGQDLAKESLAALKTWQQGRPPDNAEAFVFTVAKRAARRAVFRHRLWLPIESLLGRSQSGPDPEETVTLTHDIVTIPGSPTCHSAREVFMRPWLALFTTLAIATPALGQVQLPRDRAVFVRLASAESDLIGTVVDVRDHDFVIRHEQSVIVVPFDTVTSIQVEGDSNANGALYGAAILGTWCLLVCGQGLESGDELVGVALGNAAIGALVGAGVDALIRGRTTLYRASGKKRLVVAPTSAGVVIGYSISLRAPAR